MKHIRKIFEEDDYEVTSLQETMDDFYEEYEDSYIDANTHGVIVRLIRKLRESELLGGGDWDELSDPRSDDEDDDFYPTPGT